MKINCKIIKLKPMKYKLKKDDAHLSPKNTTGKRESLGETGIFYQHDVAPKGNVRGWIHKKTKVPPKEGHIDIR